MAFIKKKLQKQNTTSPYPKEPLRIYVLATILLGRGNKGCRIEYTFSATPGY